MISPLAVVQTDQIGENVTIREYVIVREGVSIGDGVTIHPFVVIEPGVRIGHGVEVFPGSYIGKTPKGVGSTIRPIQFEARVHIGNHCAVGPNAIIYYDVEIGENTLVGDGVSIREGSRIGSRCILGRYVTVNYETRIGNDVKIMDHAWLAGNMRIGNNIFISGGVLTANDNNMGGQGYQEDTIIGPEIHGGVRIGVGAILLPRIVIGDGAVVAAGAVVTHNVEPHQVVMGIPASVVRHLSQS